MYHVPTLPGAGSFGLTQGQLGGPLRWLDEEANGLGSAWLPLLAPNLHVVQECRTAIVISQDTRPLSGCTRLHSSAHGLSNMPHTVRRLQRIAPVSSAIAGPWGLSFLAQWHDEMASVAAAYLAYR